jgi:hypothetical protein
LPAISAAIELKPVKFPPGRAKLCTRPPTKVKLEGVEYLIMKESDIMGVLEERGAKKKAA